MSVQTVDHVVHPVFHGLPQNLILHSLRYTHAAPIIASLPFKSEFRFSSWKASTSLALPSTFLAITILLIFYESSLLLYSDKNVFIVGNVSVHAPNSKSPSFENLCPSSFFMQHSFSRVAESAFHQMCSNSFPENLRRPRPVVHFKRRSKTHGAHSQHHEHPQFLYDPISHQKVNVSGKNGSSTQQRTCASNALHAGHCCRTQSSQIVHALNFTLETVVLSLCTSSHSIRTSSTSPINSSCQRFGLQCRAKRVPVCSNICHCQKNLHKASHILQT